MKDNIEEMQDPIDQGQENTIPENEAVTDTDPLEELQAEYQELKDKYLRLFAEFDNFKKRTLKEKIEMSKMAGQDVIKSLLPVLDDFDRAKMIAEQPDSNETFSEGVKLVYQKIHSVLQSNGLKVMEIEDSQFDPELHDAITEIPVEDENMKGKIVDVIENGYYLNDKIIRHAKVVTGKK
ncbi:nucleotide exchange factor GrpE [Membranihabitans marinus]|uniref:nucleotide exchange factor GrpE n=1 Tax=Membranihabitans marinus TaxID=1227546 RepID=UPI001F358F62|nr:nucleotide exchange factor GrpE [Membranihabitans marinus]